ncbi:hypothetical protein ACMGDM_14760 [Sphingomonas sp. DT-51]|uniref:hypothetical protein n=1 Tax=Sphingomonas sp. DT-51 TaxID=3396165 RepID=UPI003F19A4A0
MTVVPRQQLAAGQHNELHVREFKRNAKTYRPSWIQSAAPLMSSNDVPARWACLSLDLAELLQATTRLVTGAKEYVEENTMAPLGQRLRQTDTPARDGLCRAPD